MSENNKKNNGLARFLGSNQGKRILNIAYSWGASVVILGTLFKLIHLPGANTMLVIGLVAECLIFFISGFDAPAKDYKWEEVYPVLSSHDPKDRPTFSNGTIINQQVDNAGLTYPQQSIQEVRYEGAQPSSYIVPAHSHEATTSSPERVVYPQGLAATASQVEDMSKQVQQFSEATAALSNLSEALAGSFEHISTNSDQISQNTKGYVEQMATLHKNISALNTIYELQLKNISSQIETFENISGGLGRIKSMYNDTIPNSEEFKDENEKMTKQIKSLNEVYARMLSAMTVNMSSSSNNPQ